MSAGVDVDVNIGNGLCVVLYVVSAGVDVCRIGRSTHVRGRMCGRRLYVASVGIGTDMDVDLA